MEFSDLVFDLSCEIDTLLRLTVGPYFGLNDLIEIHTETKCAGVLV